MLVACGGKGTTTGTQATSATTTSSGATLKVHERVAVAGPKKPAFHQRVDVRSGDTVVLQTRVAPGSPSGVTLQVTIDKGPSDQLSIKAGPQGGAAVDSATLRTMGGAKLVITGLRYKCGVGKNTFCPLTATEGAHSYVVTKTSPPTAFPISLIADIRRAPK